MNPHRSTSISVHSVLSTLSREIPEIRGNLSLARPSPPPWLSGTASASRLPSRVILHPLFPVLAFEA